MMDVPADGKEAEGEKSLVISLKVVKHRDVSRATQ